MAKTCNGCSGIGAASVPFAIHESDMARSERGNKRLWIALLAVIIALVGSNIAWVVYESQFETIENCEQNVEQHAESGENTFIGGDYYGGISENND